VLANFEKLNLTTLQNLKSQLSRDCGSPEKFLQQLIDYANPYMINK
jgi:hypothetical protein